MRSQSFWLSSRRRWRSAAAAAVAAGRAVARAVVVGALAVALAAVAAALAVGLVGAAALPLAVAVLLLAAASKVAATPTGRTRPSGPASGAPTTSPDRPPSSS